ncbi:MAG: hypothetical protein K1X94_17015 [Sandaracinaceae bacterium]|nr:hypothetical protein [Sandaracinaceae bacterium]
MTREQLEHVIRAAASIADDDELIIVGSQAVLGQFPDAPNELLVSNEVDVYPKHHPERADLIDGAIGEGSEFHETFGYYAQGVGPGTAVLPPGWELRLVPAFGPGTRGATGWCLEIHDVVLSKLIAGREKDLRYARDAHRHGLVRRSELADRLATMRLDSAVRDAVARRIDAL